MSKTASEAPPSIEIEYQKLRKELLDTKAELESSRESNKKLSTQNSKLRAKERESTPNSENGSHSEVVSSGNTGTKTSVAEVSSVKSSVTEVPEEPKGGFAEKREPKEPEMHIMQHWTPRYCGDKGCGVKNPEFKDEVECSHCGLGLGSKQNAIENLVQCPNCGRNKDNGGGWRRSTFIAPPVVSVV